MRLGTTVSVNLAARGPVQAWIERRSIGRYHDAAGVIVPSHGAAQDLARTSGLALDSIHVLPNPVTSPRLDELARAPCPHPWLEDPDIPVILGVGNLTPRKDYETLIRAFAEIRRERVCRLVILGDGKARSQLEALAGELDFPWVQLSGPDIQLKWINNHHLSLMYYSPRRNQWRLRKAGR